MYYMKKAILTTLLLATFVTEVFAQFQIIDRSGSGVQMNSNGQYQVTGQLNGNNIQITDGGLQVSGPGGYFGIGNTSGIGMGGNSGQLVGLIQMASRIIGMLVPIMISLAVVAFFWFLVNFIWKGAEDPQKHKDAMKGMGYSIVAIFAMVSIWGIIAFMGTTLGIGQGGGIPDFKLPGFK